MAEILCPFCNEIATFDKICKCLFSKNCKNSFLLPRLKDFDKKHEDNDRAKDSFNNHSSIKTWKLYPEFQQKQNVEFERVNEQGYENQKSNYIFFDNTRNRKFLYLYDTSKNLQEQNQYIISHYGFKSHVSLNGVYSDQVPRLRSSVNVGPGYRFGNDSYINKKLAPVSTETSFTHNMCETDASTFTANLSKEICEVSCDKSKGISFSIDQILSKTFPYSVSKKTFLDPENISDRADFSKNTNLSTGFTGSYGDASEKSAVPTDLTTLQKVDAQVVSIKENVVPIFQESSASLKIANTVVGLTEWRTGIIKYRNRRFDSCVGHKELNLHSKRDYHQTTTCRRRFRKKYDLKMHYRMHSNERPFGCDICNKRFKRKTHLAVHYHTHTGEWPYECDVCKKGFSQKAQLNYHNKTHANEKPFTCDICKKGFILDSRLKFHYRIHTNERPFGCDRCEKRFTRKSYLSTHYRIHTGEKPYKCAECKENFAHGTTLKRHCRIHSGHNSTNLEIVE